MAAARIGGDLLSVVERVRSELTWSAKSPSTETRPVTSVGLMRAGGVSLRSRFQGVFIPQWVTGLARQIKKPTP